MSGGCLVVSSSIGAIGPTSCRLPTTTSGLSVANIQYVRDPDESRPDGGSAAPALDVQERTIMNGVSMVPQELPPPSRKPDKANLFKCQVLGCDFVCRSKRSLKGHEANIHDINVVWNECTVDGCTYRTKEKSSLKRHLARIHNIGVVWHHCKEPGCEYKSKVASILKRHMAHKHGVEVKWFKCPVAWCGLTSKRKDHLATHMAKVHRVVPSSPYVCSFPGCNHHAKTNHLVVQHMCKAHLGLTSADEVAAKVNEMLGGIRKASRRSITNTCQQGVPYYIMRPSPGVVPQQPLQRSVRTIEDETWRLGGVPLMVPSPNVPQQIPTPSFPQHHVFMPAGGSPHFEGNLSAQPTPLFFPAR